ncbi:MAG: hypothetical protein GY856_28860 [bacterium]|nr:hypothetical protein [bacterium]
MKPAGGTVTVVGGSMGPLLRPGTRVRIRPLSGLPPLGAVLVYDAADRLVVHRLVRIEGRGEGLRLVTKGDLSLRRDPPIEPGRILGQAIRIETRWFSLSVDHPVWRVSGWLIATCAPAFVALLRAGRRVARRFKRRGRSRNEV